MLVRLTDPQRAVLADVPWWRACLVACLLGLSACTGPGLEPPGSDRRSTTPNAGGSPSGKQSDAGAETTDRAGGDGGSNLSNGSGGSTGSGGKSGSAGSPPADDADDGGVLVPSDEDAGATR